MEGGSFLVAFKEFNKSRGNAAFFKALFSSKDPTIPVVLLEDTAAVCGLVIAFLAIGISALTHNPMADALGSIVIGLLCCARSAWCWRATRAACCSVKASRRRCASGPWRLVEGTPGVLKVTQFLSMHLGPEAVILALKVRFEPKMALEEVERVIDDIEARVRAAEPGMSKIFVEPDSDYDAARDLSLRPSSGVSPSSR